MSCVVGSNNSYKPITNRAWVRFLNPLPLDLEIEVKDKGQISWVHLALVNDKKITCVLPANAKPPQFSIIFLFKINNALYISFQSFLNTQILTISHIIA